MNNLVILGVIGPWQIVLIVVIVILIFGGKKIPELFKGIGQGLNEFKKAANENNSTPKANDDEDLLENKK